MNSPKQARQTLGLSQSAMAALMGVHRQTWVKWERGEREPDAAAARLLDTLMWLREIGILIEYIGKFVLKKS